MELFQKEGCRRILALLKNTNATYSLKEVATITGLTEVSVAEYLLFLSRFDFVIFDGINCRYVIGIDYFI